MNNKVPLIIPVENQVRELDPKLLLAVLPPVAVFRFTSALAGRSIFTSPLSQGDLSLQEHDGGQRPDVSHHAYLGHEIVAWDEEALVHLPDDIYYSRRLSPKAVAQVDHFLAWGEDNAELWRRYPQMPSNAAIHVTGNPRNDLLRRELHAYYEP
jgi:surface carbohydrate biosynthesis protein